MNKGILATFIDKCKERNLGELMEKSSLFFLCCIFFSLSFAPSQGILIALLLVSSWIAYGNPFKSCWYKSYPFYWLVCYFLIHIVWLLSTENQSQGMSMVERHIPFLAFPLIIPAIIDRIDKRKKILCYHLYIVGCFLVASVSLGLALYKNFQLNHFENFHRDYFFNHNILEFIDLHATYFSLNIMIACVLIFEILRQKSKLMLSLEVVFYFLAVALFALMLYFLHARIVFVAGVTSMVLIGLFSNANKIRLIAASSLGLMILLLTVAFIYDDSFKKRTLELANIDVNQLMGTNAENGVTQRIFLWQRSIEAIKESPSFGYGTGDMYDVMRSSTQTYLQKNPSLSKISRTATESFVVNPYNPHNQFLADAIKFGLTGVFVGFAFFGSGLVIALRNRDMLLLSLVVLFFFANLTEAVLERQKGIDLFCFFYVIFVMEERSKSLPGKNEDASEVLGTT